MFDHANEHVDSGMIVLQANIDDMNPEYCSHVSDLLFERGANDVYWIPIVMKKGRPGLMLNVLAPKSKLDEMKQIVFQETTTLGVRYWDAACHRLGRRRVPIHPLGETSILKRVYRMGRSYRSPRNIVNASELRKRIAYRSKKYIKRY